MNGTPGLARSECLPVVTPWGVETRSLRTRASTFIRRSDTQELLIITKAHSAGRLRYFTLSRKIPYPTPAGSTLRADWKAIHFPSGLTTGFEALYPS